VGPTAGLDRCGKSRPTGIRSRTFQPLASRYTVYATRPTNPSYILDNRLGGLYFLSRRCREKKTCLLHMEIKTRLPCLPAHILTAVLANSRTQNLLQKLVEALRYKSEGRGFDFRRLNYNFSLT
jgi:hypothetical protein